jgi:hypothetical protein
LVNGLIRLYYEILFMAIDLTSLNASNITAGIMPTARLGSGTVSTSTYLRGDGTWVVPSLTIPGSSGQVLYNSAGALSGNSGLTFNNSTNTLSATNFVGSGSGLTNLNATYFTSGTVPTARLGTGTASINTFLRGDSSWQPLPSTPSAGSNTYIQFNNSGVFGGTSAFTFSPTGFASPLIQVAGLVDLTPVAGYPSFRARDLNANIKGGFTPYGTPFGTIANPRACGRLTYDSANPVSLSDITAATTLYYLPCNGNHITLWNSNISDYEDILLPNAGYSLSLASYPLNTVYDVFIQNNLNGTASLGLGTAWSGNNTRATALMGPTAGMLFQGGNQNWRYVGTLYIYGTAGHGTDSSTARLLWNAYNQVPRKIKFQYTGATSWNFTVANGVIIYRAVNGDDANARFYFLIGSSAGNIGIGGGQFIEVDSSIIVNMNAQSASMYHGVQLDAATANSYSNDTLSQINSPQIDLMWNKYSPSSNLQIGLHWLTIVEGLYNAYTVSQTVTIYNSGTYIHGYIMD